MRSTSQRASASVRRQGHAKRDAALKRPAALAAAAVLWEALEGRVLLSKTGPVVDAGDVRWFSKTESEHVLRATDMVLVGFEPSSAARVRRLTGALIARTGPLAGYQVRQSFDDYNSVLFQRSAPGRAPSLESLQQKIAGFPAIKHLSPTFFNLPDWQRLVIFDAVFVDLKDGVDPAPFFGKGFRSYTPRGLNAYNATLRRGGAIDALRAAARFQVDSDVESVGANTGGNIVLTSAPNDVLYANGSQWNLPKVNIPAVWDNKTIGSPDITIAILDNGVQTDHEDLSGNKYLNAFDLGRDEDGNDLLNDTSGWNFYEWNSDAGPSITSGENADKHATAVAGIAAGRGNNVIGVTGASQQSKILSVRMVEGGAVASPTRIADAIMYAGGFNTNGARIWRGADVISGSWAAPSDPAITLAITLVSSSGRGGLGIPVFFSAGNEGTKTNHNVVYPAKLSASNSNVVSVGASLSNDTRAGYSGWTARLTEK